MSLRTKILLLFQTLAIAPLLTVAGVAYVQSQRALEELMRRRVETVARVAARDLRDAMDRLTERVEELAQDSRVERLLGEDLVERDRALAEITAHIGSAWGVMDNSFESVAIHKSDGVLLYGSQMPVSAVSDASRCPAVDWSSGITITRPVRGPGGFAMGRVSGTIPFDVLFDRESLDVRLGVDGTTIVVDRTRERLLHVAGCEAFTDAAEILAWTRASNTGSSNPGRPTSTHTFEGSGTARHASFVELSSPPWTVVVTGGMESFMAPFRQLQQSYGLFVILVALSTALAFSILINRFMRSLADLSAAADRIGEGEMSPWLPPPGEDEVGRLSLAIGRMAERIRQMMSQIDRSGRMAVIGELASYLAHEIRNPLSSIKLNLQTLSREVERGNLPEDTSHEIGICLREVRRLEQVVSSVLKLGRGRPAEALPGSLHGVVSEAIQLVSPELERTGVAVDARLEALDDTVSADFAQMKGVFLNLLLNASDAMPKGGLVRVWTESSREPPRVVVHITDEGAGISSELRDRIFEPFFTTKSDGSGIGLSLALRTVEDHGGRLFLEKRSEADRGAAFVVELPLLRPGDVPTRVGQAERRDEDGTGGDPPATDSDQSTAVAEQRFDEREQGAKPISVGGLPAPEEWSETVSRGMIAPRITTDGLQP